MSDDDEDGTDHHRLVDDRDDPLSKVWSDDGWWRGATDQREANTGRVGGLISPWATVVHTTDMVPEDFDALLNGWTSQKGNGACAHFVIGRSATEGVIQLIPVDRNGNHAGGAGHGVFDTDDATDIHPNEVSIGIEVFCAGGVRKFNGEWRFFDPPSAAVPHGAPLPDDDVTPDPDRPGHGWHNVTDYQREQLDLLLTDLELRLGALPAGARTRAIGDEAVPAWGVPTTARIVGHVSLHPKDRSDPWPPMCQWLFHDRAQP